MFQNNITLFITNHQPKMTITSYNNCTNYCPSCSIHFSHVLSTDLRTIAQSTSFKQIQQLHLLA